MKESETRDYQNGASISREPTYTHSVQYKVLPSRNKSHKQKHLQGYLLGSGVLGSFSFHVEYLSKAQSNMERRWFVDPSDGFCIRVGTAGLVRSYSNRQQTVSVKCKTEKERFNSPETE